MSEIVNVFKFLKEFNELQNPVITEITNQKWSLDILEIPVIDEIRNVFWGHELDELDFLEIRRPTILPCPSPPEELLGWIKNDWKKLSIEIIDFEEKLSREIWDDNGDKSILDELFTQNMTRVEASHNWISIRSQWLESEVPKDEGLKIYNKLYELYSDMQKEAESVELILGDGNIRCKTAKRIIDHPVLLQKVFLSFDTSIPSFRIYCEEKKSEIYTPMLRMIPSVNQKLLADIMSEIDKESLDISVTQYTSDFFRRVINVCDTKGVFIDKPKSITEDPTIYSAPVLFLRKRTLGFSNFIESVVEEVETKPEIKLPKFFDVMTGKYTQKINNETVEKNWNYSGIDEEVLLTLPANNEQLRIIKYLDEYGAVLVQGPPGTGKTHTIANLIGHLLSKGNSILVTSHTEKALSVLKEKVYRDKNNPELNLQKLCISLQSSTSQKKEMDEVITEIASKNGTLDLNRSKENIISLERERKELIEESKGFSEELTSVRSKVYLDLIFDNHTISPIDAAKFLKSGEHSYDYISGKSNKDDVGFPLTDEELGYLYSITDKLSLEEENLLKQIYPSDNQILSSLDFTKRVDSINDLTENINKYSILQDATLTIDYTKIERILGCVNELINSINGFDSLQKAIINQTINDQIYPELWIKVIKDTEVLLAKSESYRKLKLQNNFDIDNSILKRTTLESLQNIIDMKKEKPVGIFSKKDWKKIKESISLDGVNVESRDDFKKALEIISYEIEKQEIITQIEKLLHDINTEDTLTFNNFEKLVHRYQDSIKLALNWFRNYCHGCLKEVEESISWREEKKLQKVLTLDNVDEVSNFLNIAKSLLQGKIIERNYEILNDEFSSYEELLSGYADSNIYIKNLFGAVIRKNKEEYSRHLFELNNLIRKKQIVETRQQLLSRIKEISPSLAMQIEKREGVHSLNTIPKDFHKAWKYFQLRNQFERLDEIDSTVIQSKIEKKQ